jgi:hypothetical protein
MSREDELTSTARGALVGAVVKVEKEGDVFSIHISGLNREQYVALNDLLFGATFEPGSDFFTNDHHNSHQEN